MNLLMKTSLLLVLLVSGHTYSSVYDFSGIVKLSNCSGALVIYEGQSFETKAKVLTNGHCVSNGIFRGMIKPGEVVSNRFVKNKMTLYKDLKTRFSIQASKIIYATMTDTDLALYELNETYQKLIERTGVYPLVLSSQKPFEGTMIEIISGYWETGYSCSIEKIVHRLQEGKHFFVESIRYSPGCNTKGGTSGSPIIDPLTREVIGVNNTANESGRRCANNNPCEIDEDNNVSVHRGKKYGQQVYRLYTCLDENKEFSLQVSGCALPQ